MALVIGMLTFPAITQLDLTGPYEILHRIPGASVHLVWKTTEPVRTEQGFALLPDTTFETCPPLDVLFVPGGFGTTALMDDPEVLAFLRARAETARYVTSVCTGALVLAAAGLLDGRRATTHWAYTGVLEGLGAVLEKGRVVRDGNRITAGGVTAGIDFALVVAAEVAGEAVARSIQLGLEYDPAPPFDHGHPDRADPAVVDEIRARLMARYAAARAATTPRR